jgi:hypothetical protein
MLQHQYAHSAQAFWLAKQSSSPYVRLGFMNPSGEAYPCAPYAMSKAQSGEGLKRRQLIAKAFSILRFSEAHQDAKA